MLIVPLLAAGCIKFDRQATVSSTEEFRKLLVEELRQSGQVEDFGNGGGEAGNIYTMDYGYSMPTNSFPPGRLFAAAQAAAKKWGQLDQYSTTGRGGDDNRFEMDYGSHSTHAFIDVIAYPERDETHIEILIRVVQ